MATFYKPKYLSADELVDRATYNDCKNRGILEYIFWQFNPLVLITADLLRERFGAITVNNWNHGGSFQNRGLRNIDSGVGSKYSAHKRGAALDCNFADASAVEIREIMKKAGCFKPGFKDRTDLGEDECFRHIGRVEMTQSGKPISWFHFDIWNNQSADGSILTFGA